MSDADLTALVFETLAAVAGAKNVGTVMAAAMVKARGQASGARVRKAVEAALSS